MTATLALAAGLLLSPQEAPPSEWEGWNVRWDPQMERGACASEVPGPWGIRRIENLGDLDADGAHDFMFVAELLSTCGNGPEIQYLRVVSGRGSKTLYDPKTLYEWEAFGPLQFDIRERCAVRVGDALRVELEDRDRDGVGELALWEESVGATARIELRSGASNRVIFDRVFTLEGLRYVHDRRLERLPDLDGDGRADLLLCGRGSLESGRGAHPLQSYGHVFVIVSSRSFDVIDLGLEGEVAWMSSGPEGTEEIHVGLRSASGRRVVAVSRRGGRELWSVPPDAAPWIDPIATVGDFDGDGRLDLLVVVEDRMRRVGFAGYGESILFYSGIGR